MAQGFESTGVMIDRVQNSTPNSSWIFPTNVARFSQTFGPGASRRSTPLFISGTLGAALSTWTIGFVSGRTGSLLSGMYLLLIAVILLIGLQVVLSIRVRSGKLRTEIQSS